MPAGLRRGAFGRGRRRRSWRRRSWPGRGRRGCPGPRREERSARGRAPLRQLRAGAWARALPWRRRRGRGARRSASRSWRRRGRRRCGGWRPGGGPGDLLEELSSWAFSETSQALIVALAPSSSSSCTSSFAPSALGPPLLTKSRWRAPWALTRWRAVRAPRVPVAPVIKTVRPGSISGAESPLGISRRLARGTVHSLAQGELGVLTEGKGDGQGLLGCLAPGVGVDQGETAGMLGLGRAHQAPYRRRRGVGGLRLSGGDRAFGEDRQALALGSGSASHAWTRSKAAMHWLRRRWVASSSSLPWGQCQSSARGPSAGLSASSASRHWTPSRPSWRWAPWSSERSTRAHRQGGNPGYRVAARVVRQQGYPPPLASSAGPAAHWRRERAGRPRSRQRAAPVPASTRSARRRARLGEGRRRAGPDGCRSAASRACSSASEPRQRSPRHRARPRSGPGRRGRTHSPPRRGGHRENSLSSGSAPSGGQASSGWGACPEPGETTPRRFGSTAVPLWSLLPGDRSGSRARGHLARPGL